MRRLVGPREIANACVFLASPESSGMTGAEMVVDAGTFGNACLVAADCQSLLCRGAGDAAGSCTSDCSNAPCGTGFDCANDDNLGTMVCVPHVAQPSGHGCSAGDGGTPAGAAVRPGRFRPGCLRPGWFR